MTDDEPDNATSQNLSEFLSDVGVNVTESNGTSLFSPASNTTEAACRGCSAALIGQAVCCNPRLKVLQGQSVTIAIATAIVAMYIMFLLIPCHQCGLLDLGRSEPRHSPDVAGESCLNPISDSSMASQFKTPSQARLVKTEELRRFMNRSRSSSQMCRS